MTRARFQPPIPAALTLGFALILPISAAAQPGPGLSSGSGEGTGTGYSTGVQRNRSNSVSGVGPGSPLSGPFERGEGLRGMVPGGPPGFSVPMGPGVDVSFPDDTSLFPFMPIEQDEGPGAALSAIRVSPKELDFARTITDPADRSLTLQRVANVAIFSSQLGLAHQALNEAAPAALSIHDPVVHDLRLIALVTAQNNLSEAHIREGKTDLSLTDFEEDAAALPKRSPIDRPTLIRRSELEWQRAAYLASRICNPTYRSEMLYRVADSQAFGSQTVVNEFPHNNTNGNGAARPGETGSTAKTDEEVRNLADGLLVGASRIAMMIKRPVWRDRALVAVASAAAQSRQFARGLQVARMIPQPEVRTDALLKIAESQARPFGNDPNGATQTYREAAEAVASIPLEDPRAVLAGVLIDSLISVGRFEDARRMIGLYPDDSLRIRALGAVAESQGFRGASDSAVEWIQREVPPHHQPFLYRRLRFGMLAAVEQNRSRDLSNRER